MRFDSAENYFWSLSQIFWQLTFVSFPGEINDFVQDANLFCGLLATSLIVFAFRSISHANWRIPGLSTGRLFHSMHVCASAEYTQQTNCQYTMARGSTTFFNGCLNVLTPLYWSLFRAEILVKVVLMTVMVSQRCWCLFFYHGGRWHDDKWSSRWEDLRAFYDRRHRPHVLLSEWTTAKYHYEIKQENWCRRLGGSSACHRVSAVTVLLYGGIVSVGCLHVYVTKLSSS